MSLTTSTIMMYQGHATEVFHDSNNDAWYVVIDGERIKIDPNDLFGVNKNSTAQIDEQIERSEQNIEYYQARIDENNNLYALAKEKINDTRSKIYSFLKNAGVTNPFNLNKEDKAEYANLIMQNQEAKADKNMASSAVIRTCHSCMDEIFYKGELENQRSFLC